MIGCIDHAGHACGRAQWQGGASVLTDTVRVATDPVTARVLGDSGAVTALLLARSGGSRARRMTRCPRQPATDPSPAPQGWPSRVRRSDGHRRRRQRATPIHCRQGCPGSHPMPPAPPREELAQDALPVVAVGADLAWVEEGAQPPRTVVRICPPGPNSLRTKPWLTNCCTTCSPPPASRVEAAMACAAQEVGTPAVLGAPAEPPLVVVQGHEPVLSRDGSGLVRPARGVA